MKTNLTLLKVICLTITCLFSSESLAVMQGMSTEELTRSSDIVLEGEVKNVKAYWSKDGKTIFSRAIILDSYVIKGRITQKPVVVEYEGGEIGDTGLKVSDVVPLKKGEKVILFLKIGKSKQDGQAMNIVGKGQGKYVIGDDGIARKGGFSVIHGEELIDNNIHVDKLINKIKKIE